MTTRNAIRTALGLLLLSATAGCGRGPDRTPTAAPVEYDEPAGDDQGEPAPMGPEPRRIETH